MDIQRLIVRQILNKGLPALYYELCQLQVTVVRDFSKIPSAEDQYAGSNYIARAYNQLERSTKTWLQTWLDACKQERFVALRAGLALQDTSEYSRWLELIGDKWQLEVKLVALSLPLQNLSFRSDAISTMRVYDPAIDARLSTVLGHLSQLNSSLYSRTWNIQMVEEPSNIWQPSTIRVVSLWSWPEGLQILRFLVTLSWFLSTEDFQASMGALVTQPPSKSKRLCTELVQKIANTSENLINDNWWADLLEMLETLPM